MATIKQRRSSLGRKLEQGASRPAALAADGTPRLPRVAHDEDGYPYDDGAPLGENQNQIAQILYAAPALEALLEERPGNAFVGCGMFVAPRESTCAWAMPGRERIS